ncbi:MAG: alpha/beta hydrolase [Planctomycetaceae bacterium]|nr:alpha/beta hydrolase [Planctomycetaceae bacterium]
MSTRAIRWVVAAAIAALILGAILSRAIEPGVRVEKIMLTANTPALRLFPATPGPHPIALLTHGNGASKEMLFRFGEALAAAGFDCYSVDQAGFGESPQSCSLTNLRHKPQELERALGAVDVFIGHSMGSSVGAWSVREAGFRPKLFIGVGNTAKLGEHGPPLLLLFGRFGEFGKPAITNAEVVISPWSNHALEPFDPVLVNAAVKAACAAVGKPVSAAPTAWRWRLAGLVLGMASALVLTFRLPELHPSLVQNRRWIVPTVLLIAIILTTGTWLGLTPKLRRIPQQLVLLVVIWLALAGLSKVRMPRWSLPVVTGIMTLGCVTLVIACANPTNFFPFVMLTLISGGSTVALLSAVVVGGIATRGGSRRDGDVAMALFASYAIGQFMPLFY